MMAALQTAEREKLDVTVINNLTSPYLFLEVFQLTLTQIFSNKKARQVVLGLGSMQYKNISII